MLHPWCALLILINARTLDTVSWLLRIFQAIHSLRRNSGEGNLKIFNDAMMMMILDGRWMMMMQRLWMGGHAEPLCLSSPLLSLILRHCSNPNLIYRSTELNSCGDRPRAAARWRQAINESQRDDSTHQENDHWLQGAKWGAQEDGTPTNESEELQDRSLQALPWAKWVHSRRFLPLYSCHRLRM